MPSAGKSVIELTTNDGRHVAWVEIAIAERAAFLGPALREPIVLLWGTRSFVWTTAGQHGYFVFAEASVIVSRTPSPGLASPDGSGPPPLGERP